MSGDDDIDLVRHALEQPQPDEVVLDRIRGGQVRERDQDVGQHVAGDENATLLDEQRRMALGVRRMLDDPDSGAVPGDLRRLGRQTGQEAELVERDVLGDFRR